MNNERRAMVQGIYGSMTEHQEAERRLRAAAEAVSAEKNIPIEEAIEHLRPSITPQPTAGRWLFTPKKKQ